MPTAGAAVDWFARVGALPPAAQLDALLRKGDDDGSVVCVPARQGTGVPSWNADADALPALTPDLVAEPAMPAAERAQRRTRRAAARELSERPR